MTSPTLESVVAPVLLEGRHVRLEPLDLGHLDALLEAATIDRSTYQWTQVPNSAGEMRAYVEEALRLRDEAKAVPFATVRRADGLVVGSTRFATFEWHAWPEGNPNHRAGHPDGVEIGWTWLSSKAQRTAINTEAKYLMMRHAFETWRVKVVRLKTDSRNARSRAAIERIGCAFDGVIRAHSPGADGSFRDSAYYSMLETGWPAARAALEARLARA
jgi:RimJ/RimL family protein N-acetyltransferase